MGSAFLCLLFLVADNYLDFLDSFVDIAAEVDIVALVGIAVVGDIAVAEDIVVVGDIVGEVDIGSLRVWVWKGTKFN